MNIYMNKDEFPHFYILKQQMVDHMGFFFQGCKRDAIFTEVEIPVFDLFAKADIGVCFVENRGCNCCLKFGKFLVHYPFVNHKVGKQQKHEQ